ncbi:MAG: hypothetical protein ABIO24_11275 [Saprospiraceae bacterium]
MKHFMPVYATLLVLAFFTLWCCTDIPPSPKPMTTSGPVIPLDTCSVDALNTTTAMAEKNAWLDKRRSMIGNMARTNPGDSMFLAKSFRLRKCDITGMLAALSDTTAYRRDSIWATLAIRNNQVTLIFHDYDLKRKTEVYYDFSRPCPPGICE